MKKKVSIWLSITLVFQLFLGTLTVSASEAKSSDISGHWAEQTIQSWLDKGIAKGYQDGSFRPDASITRAEFIKMMNQVFEVPKAQSNVSFEDLTEKHWAYADIAAAVEAGYISGTSETTVSPDANITRQEAAVMLVKLVKLEGTTELNFKDAADIPEWSKKAITALVAGNFLQGDTAGNVRAKDQLKRAEAVVLIDKVSQSLETVFDQEGEYGNLDKFTVINGDVRIAAAGVTLINTEITGNLTVDAAVGEGDVYLKKVVVKGTTLIQGGGENSVHLEDTVVLRIVVDKASGKVRIVAQGATKVQQVVVQSPVKLEESQVTDSGFSNIELTPNLPEGSNIDLVGHFENVHVISANIKITIPSGSVKQLSVGDEAAGNTISLDQSATIETLILDVVTKLIGQGTVNKAQVSTAAQSSSFETAPKQLEVVEKGAPTATPTPTAEPEPIVVPPSKPTPKPTSTVTPSPSASANPTPTVAPTPSASANPTPTVAPSPSASTNPTPTVTPTPSASLNPTPSVTPTQKPADQMSNDATIHSFSLNEELLLTKMNLTKNSALPVEGFDPTYYLYAVDLPENQNKIKVTMQIDTEENAFINVNVRDRMGYYKSIQLEKQDNEYTFELDTDKYYYASISIMSESEIYHKNYQLYFVGNVDIQQKFKIQNNDGNYSLVSQHVKAGDLITVTIPAQHSKTNEEVVITTQKYSTNYKDGGYSFIYLYLNEQFVPSSSIGELGLKIERNGKSIYDGKYKFDLTEVDFKEMPDSIAEFDFATKEEVNEYNNRGNHNDMKAFEYTVAINEKELLSLYPEAALVSYRSDSITYNSHKLRYTLEEVKNYRTVYGSNLSNLNTTHGFASWYDPTNNLDVYEVPTGQIMRIMIYDAQGNLIGAFIKIFEVPEENLADHVVPSEVISEKELEGVPLELTAIQTTGIEWYKNLAYNDSDEVIEDLSFASDYSHYIGTVEETSDEQTIIFEPIAAKGLQIHAAIERRTLDKSKFEYSSIRDVHKNGLSLRFDSNYVYKVVIEIQNPYTSESSYYNFSFQALELIEDSFKLDSMYLNAKNLLIGDRVEVTIPKQFSMMNDKDYVHSHVVSKDEGYFDNFTGNFVSDLNLDLRYLYDSETGEVINGFNHNNESGELAIKVIRNEDVIYEGVLSFDFSLVTVFDNVSVYRYSAEELDQYNAANNTEYRVVFQYDFSAIEGAAYIGQSYSLQPNVQDAQSMSSFIQLDAGKFVLGIRYFPEGTTIDTFNDGFYVYDSNYQVLGYASILYEVSEAESTANQEAVPVSNEEAGAEQQEGSAPVANEETGAESQKDSEPVSNEEAGSEPTTGD